MVNVIGSTVKLYKVLFLYETETSAWFCMIENSSI